jgi:hypothetical protein
VEACWAAQCFADLAVLALAAHQRRFAEAVWPAAAQTVFQAPARELSKGRRESGNNRLNKEVRLGLFAINLDGSSVYTPIIVVWYIALQLETTSITSLVSLWN